MLLLEGNNIAGCKHIWVRGKLECVFDIETAKIGEGGVDGGSGWRVGTKEGRVHTAAAACWNLDDENGVSLVKGKIW